MKTYIPESLINAESQAYAKQVFEKMSDSELLEQEISLRNLLNDLPKRQLKLAEDHERVLQEIRDSAIFATAGRQSRQRFG